MHTHEEFSPLDGTGSRNQLTREAVKHGQTHLGCTNHGRLGSVLDHIHACRHPEAHDDPDDPSVKRSKDERLIPIVGIEAFWRPDRFMDLTDKDLYGKNGHNWAQHLCVHAGSMNGWKTLMRLSSKSWVPREKGGGFYGKPCFDWDMLENDHEDIIISTACIASPLSQMILNDDETGAKAWLKEMASIVGQDNVFLEIMPHDIDMQRKINIEKVNLANELGMAYMVTGDVHMPYKEWADTQSVVRMASYRTTISKQEKKTEAGEEVYTSQIDTIYLSGEDELQQMFDRHHPDLPEHVVDEGLANTVEFVKRFRPYVIGKSVKLPKASDDPEETSSILRGWARDGLKHYNKWTNQIYRERLDYEYGVIERKGTLDYFYIVGNLLRWANSDQPLPATADDPSPPAKRPINTDVRGSAAGCLFSWAIGITTMDPIAWGLKFERFLNPDRVGLPDIDIDIESDLFDFTILDKPADGRDMCIEFLRRTYGHDHVAAIIAYQTFAPRAVIKAVADTQDIPFVETKHCTDSIGDTERELQKLILDNETLEKFMKKYPDVWKHVQRLEDQVVRDSRHAAGILITPKPATDYMPTQLGSDEETVVTAWADRAEFPIVSDYGFVKLDVLGVRGLAKQELARRLIQEHYGEDFDLRNQPEMFDPWDSEQGVLDVFTRGLTLGLFQFSGRGITQLLRHIKPDNAMDISVANALYRPGPMKMAFEYGDRKNGLKPVTYWHDSLEPILGETLGLMCFQEQAMDVVQTLAGFSGADADNFRKIMSKLYRLPGDAAQRVMQKDHDRFIEGCMKSGLKEQEAEDLWSEKMLPLGNYLFNKSHSSDYGLRAIVDARIKLHYPLAFYASLLTLEKKSKREEQLDFLKGVMREAAVFDINVRPPSINTSDLSWTIDGDDIRYGLVSISGLGGASASDIIKLRPFESFKSFIKTMPSSFGSDNVVSLSKAGAMDELIERDHLLSKVRRWPETVKKVTFKMSCGCAKSRTIKLTDTMLELINAEYDPEELVDADREKLLEMAEHLVLEEVECKKHEDATVDEDTIEEIDPFYFAAAWYKDNEGIGKPKDLVPPTHDELMAYEEEALNLPLSLRQIASDYKSFLEERIYTEAEVEELSDKPNRKKGKHDTYCNCKECEDSHCVVGGEVINVKVITTKQKKEKMAFVDVAHGSDVYSVTIFPWVYRNCSKLLSKPTILLIAGHKQTRNGQPQILAYEVRDVIKVAEADGFKPKPKLKIRSIAVSKSKAAPIPSDVVLTINHQLRMKVG